MQLQESGEMYLETILILTRDKTNVRSIDVVEYREGDMVTTPQKVPGLKKYGNIFGRLKGDK